MPATPPPSTITLMAPLSHAWPVSAGLDSEVRVSRGSPTLDALLLGADRARSRSPLPVLLCIDLEPHKHLVDRRDPGRWPGFEPFAAEVPRLRERLSEITGHPAAFT